MFFINCELREAKIASLKICNIFTVTKFILQLGYELKEFAEQHIIRQRMFGLRDNIETWSNMMSVYIPKY